MKNTCKVLNGFVQIGDIVTIVSFGNKDRYLYKVIGFGEYKGKPQVNYKKVVPQTLEYFPESAGSQMDFVEATKELKIIFKKKLFGGFKRV